MLDRQPAVVARHPETIAEGAPPLLAVQVAERDLAPGPGGYVCQPPVFQETRGGLHRLVQHRVLRVDVNGRRPSAHPPRPADRPPSRTNGSGRGWRRRSGRWSAAASGARGLVDELASVQFEGDALDAAELGRLDSQAMTAQLLVPPSKRAKRCSMAPSLTGRIVRSTVPTVDYDAAVFEKETERLPMAQRVAGRLGEGGFGRDTRERLLAPRSTETRM
jgi:hypothetical protein